MSHHSLHLSDLEIVRSAEKINSFVGRLAREYFLDGPDRRSEPRFRVTLPVNVRPLDSQQEPLGYQVRAVTRDISSKGVGLTCQDPISTDFVALQVANPHGEDLEVVAEVLRCGPVGYYFDVGCRFVVD